VRAVGCEHDVVGWDEEDRIRDGVLGGWARLHGEDVGWGRCAAGQRDVKGSWDAGARELRWYYCRGD